jgi:uncharacterized protein YecT (DUF1311 family)
MIRTGTALFALALAAAAMPAWAGALPVRTVTIKQDGGPNMLDIAYPQTGVKAIDTDLAARVKTLRKLYAHDPKDTFTKQYSLDIGYDVARNDKQMFVVVFGIDTYTGGAHPNHDIETFNYLLPGGARVYLPEIVGHDGIAHVSDLAIADLEQQNATNQFSDADWIANGAGPRESNLAAFAWLPDKLRLYFPPYRVAAYAAGGQEVDIPLAELRGDIRADWRAPLPSFDCAKAQTDIERALCNDTRLARLDRWVADEYARVLALRTDPKTKQQARQAQRAWLGTRNARCGDKNGAALTGCLRPVYAARLAALKRTY